MAVTKKSLVSSPSTTEKSAKTTKTSASVEPKKMNTTLRATSRKLARNNVD